MGQKSPRLTQTSAKGVRVTGYKHPVRAYAELYGIPLGTIQHAYSRKWPLDDPLELLKKFEKAPGPKTNLDTLRSIVNGTVKDNPLPPVDLEEDAAMMSMALAGGLTQELARLKAECAQSHRAYLAEQRPADKLTRQKVWLANVAALRQLAKEAPKAERDAKNVLLISDVESTWTRSLKECKTSLESLARRVSTNILFAKLDPVEVEEVIQKEVAGILSHLERGSWLEQKD